MSVPAAERARFRTEELLAAAEAYQRMLIGCGVTPDPSRLLIRRARGLVRAFAAVLLGVVTAAFAIVVTFLVFNVLFHID